MSYSQIVKRLKLDIDKNRLVQAGQRVVVGVSGGPDSVALLHLMVELNAAENLALKLHVAHLNHQIRGDEADADTEFVSDMAKTLGLPCTIEREDVPAIAVETKRSVEETGRARRYAFLERVCLRAESELVAVAHHADDNVETVLHHIVRGTGLRGLSGMPVLRPLNLGSNVRLIRPLLGFRRSELLEYLRDRGLSYRTDCTNESDEHTRNRLRNRLLPMLREGFNPQVDEALLRLAEQAQWFEEYLDATAARTFETLVVSQTDQELVLNVDTLLRKSPIIQTELIRRAIMTFWSESVHRGEWLDREIKELGFHNLRAVVELAADKQSGRKLSLPGDMTVTRQYHRLVFALPGRQAREASAAEITVTCPGRTVLPLRRLGLVTEILGLSFQEWASIRPSKPRNQELLDFEQIRLPLVVRSRRPGDRFWPLGAPGNKKLSDYFIDAKIPPDERVHTAILCDQLGPVWIIGHRIDERVRLRRSTQKALRITAEPLQSGDMLS